MSYKRTHPFNWTVQLITNQVSTYVHLTLEPAVSSASTLAISPVPSGSYSSAACPFFTSAFVLFTNIITIHYCTLEQPRNATSTTIVVAVAESVTITTITTTNLHRRCPTDRRRGATETTTIDRTATTDPTIECSRSAACLRTLRSAECLVLS